MLKNFKRTKSEKLYKIKITCQGKNTYFSEIFVIGSSPFSPLVPRFARCIPYGSRDRSFFLDRLESFHILLAMPTIRVLSEDVIAKIAAGEVVERPSSVVKELVENSIDAGSDRIIVEVSSGGKRMIKVTDDGSGMSPDDAVCALKRYATSKIEAIEDLFRIETLGFRGEALPSIAAVSHFELSTKMKSALSGFKLRVRGGEIVERSEIGRAEGTTVVVNELFFNLPARKKFLKSIPTELKHIVDELLNFALSFPDISFKLVHNGRVLLDIKKLNELEDRVSSLFGEGMVKDGITVRYESPQLSIYGKLGHPDKLIRDQFIFVNGRRVRNRTISHAIYSVYEQTTKEKHPLIILWLKVEPSSVDVNVHPRKREVKFYNETLIHSIVFESMKNSLTKPEIFYEKRDVYGISEEDFFRKIEIGRGLFQIHNSYIVFELPDGFAVVDQHAAHERILFEKFERDEIFSQKLLFPITIDLSTPLAILMREYSNSIEKAGFGITEFSGKTIVVDAVPTVVSECNPKNFLIELLYELERSGKVPNPRLEFLKVFVCKAAVKAGQPLKEEERLSIIRDLFRCKNPNFCPHGRPTFFKLTIEEIEKRLKRK